MGTGVDVRAAASVDRHFDETDWYASVEGVQAYSLEPSSCSTLSCPESVDHRRHPRGMPQTRRARKTACAVVAMLFVECLYCIGRYVEEQRWLASSGATGISFDVMPQG